MNSSCAQLATDHRIKRGVKTNERETACFLQILNLHRFVDAFVRGRRRGEWKNVSKFYFKCSWHFNNRCRFVNLHQFINWKLIKFCFRTPTTTRKNSLKKRIKFKSLFKELGNGDCKWINNSLRYVIKFHEMCRRIWENGRKCDLYRIRGLH